jgi:hypothetical protein
VASEAKATAIARWKNPNTPLQTIVNEGGMDYVTRKPAISDDYVRVSTVKEGDLLEPQEIDEIKDYTLNGYLVNEFLRTGKELYGETIESTLNKINTIRTGLSKLPRFVPDNLNPPSRFLTNERILDRYKEGEVYIEAGFSSFSKKVSGTGKFKDESSKFPVKLIVRPREKSIARDIEHLNKLGEEEILYLLGTKFKVLRKTQEEFKDLAGVPFKRWVVEIEEADG